MTKTEKLVPISFTALNANLECFRTYINSQKKKKSKPQELLLKLDLHITELPKKYNSSVHYV